MKREDIILHIKAMAPIYEKTTFENYSDRSLLKIKRSIEFERKLREDLQLKRTDALYIMQS